MSTDSGADSAARAKRLIALSSVAAGIGLTLFKVAIGLATGSLGILAEAAHSGLDLVAALMTFLAVRLADRPPDPSHPYGHGKVENLSAFLEAGLLLVTAAWIGFEAVQRLVVHQIHVQASAWAFLHDLVIHLTMQGNLGIPQVHARSEDIERALRAAIPGLARVLIHAEPPE